MTGTSNVYRDLIAASLAALGGSLGAGGAGQWDFALPGAGLSGHASIAAGWLALCAPCGHQAQSISPWELLLRQGLLIPPWRFIVAPSSAAPAVVGELRLRRAGDVAGRVAWLCAGAAAALALAAGESAIGVEPVEVPVVDEPVAANSVDLSELLRTGGWSHREAAGKGFVVDLPSTRGFFQATVSTDARAGVRLSVVVARCGELAQEPRDAIAALLLSVAGAVRQVGASIVQGDEGPAVELGVVGLDAAVAGDLDDALSALTTAVDLCGPEVMALQDAALASRYLAARGRSSCPQTTPQPAPVS
jgi:hypothetical protein